MTGSHTLPEGISCRLLSYGDLTASDLERWRALCHGHETYDSALLTPEFAYLVARVREDVRIAAFERGDQLEAVFACHLRPDGLARPLGAPFSDYTGPVFSRDTKLSLSAMLKAAGIAAYETVSMPDPWDKVVGVAPGEAGADGKESHVIRLGGQDTSTFLEAQRTLHPKRFKNFRRLASQLQRDIGTPHLRWGKPSADEFDLLMAYKSQQYRQSGLVDVTAATQPRRLLEAVAASEHGFCVSLWVNDTLISGHFGLRVGTSFHPWIAAFNPAFSHYSPGNLLLLLALQNLTEMGIATYDLANGHDHYKKYFANASRPAKPVFATGGGVKAWRHRANRHVWQIVGASAPSSATARLKRRMDQIAVSEFAILPRIRAFAYAVLARALLRRKV